MQEQSKSAYEKICRELVDNFNGELTWQWDPRFEAVLTEFKQEAKNRVRETLDKYLSYLWDNSGLKQAPEIVQTIGSRLGGLMTNQLLFTSDPDHAEIIFCAWWPWGDGNTISIRLAPFYDDSNQEEKIEKIKFTKELFEI